MSPANVARVAKQAVTATASAGVPPLITAGFAVAALAAVGGLGAVRLLDRGIEEGPEEVLDAYVQATLSANDDQAAAALTCRAPRLDSIRNWQRDLANQRQRLNLPPLQTSVAAYHDTRTDGAVNATTRVTVTLSIDGQPQEQLTRPYTFTLTHEHGWKVCTAAETL
jgi:hypothetical protein